MNTQKIEPNISSGGVHLNIAEKQDSVLDLIGDLLGERSKLKKNVGHNSDTIDAAKNNVLGAMVTEGSTELMVDIYNCIEQVLFTQLQRVCQERNWNYEYQEKLKDICEEISQCHPFAHRTTVQGMINGHTKESSDLWLEKSFSQSIAELEANGYKPPAIAINQDPHFSDFKPSFKNQEIRQILIGGRTTLRTGYQFNVSNITPIGLCNAISLAPKRQINQKDLGDLQYAVVYGKAIERTEKAGLSLKHMQADRGLAVLGVFAISQQHCWPTSAGNLGQLTEATRDAFLVAPWSSTRMTKQDLLLKENFSEITIKTSDLLRSQYSGEQPLVQKVLGQDPKCKVPIETVILTLRKENDKYCNYNAIDVQTSLSKLADSLLTLEKKVNTLENTYFDYFRKINPDYKDRGLVMKLNSKSISRLSNESQEAWDIRKQYRLIQQKIKTGKRKRDAYLRSFQVFEIGVDHAALALLQGNRCKEQIKLINHLKSCAKDYSSRWCIESGFQTIEYQFPLNYQGYSSDSHLRYFVIQAMVFNSYRVAQIMHIRAKKPHNWRPWDPKKKLSCRQFSAADRKGFTAKGYILDLLKRSLNSYFCRTLI